MRITPSCCIAYCSKMHHLNAPRDHFQENSFSRKVRGVRKTDHLFVCYFCCWVLLLPFFLFLVSFENYIGIVDEQYFTHKEKEVWFVIATPLHDIYASIVIYLHAVDNTIDHPAIDFSLPLDSLTSKPENICLSQISPACNHLESWVMSKSRKQINSAPVAMA